MKTPIYVDKLYKYDLQAEPCSVAVPFAKGVLAEEKIKELTITDAQGNTVPCAFFSTAKWPDGSVKYLFARFMPDLQANKNMIFTLTDEAIKESVSGAVSEVKMSSGAMLAKESEACFSVDTGKLKFTVKNQSDTIFQCVEANGRCYSGTQFVGPVLKESGEVFENATSKVGIGKSLFIENWSVVENNAVCCILEGCGHYSADRRIDVRITAYTGKDYLELSFRLFNDSEKMMIPDFWNFYVLRDAGKMPDDSLTDNSKKMLDSTGCGDMNGSDADASRLLFKTTGTGALQEIEEEIREKSECGIRTLTGISNYKTRFEISGEGADLSNIITAESLIQEANEHFAEVLYGTFMADVCNGEAGICGTIFQAHQNYPKAIKATKDGLCICLIPEGKEKVCFSAGMAREQRIMLHFHSADIPIEELDNRSLIYQMPVEPWVAPECFKEAEVFPAIVTPAGKHNDTVELALINKADHHGRAYGMMNWGDFPDANYTAQGRGGGRLVWSNNEYDYPHAMFMMYARTGVRRFLDYAKVAAWHWMDVDVCHFSSDPLLLNGQWEHTACHNGGDFAETSVRGVMVCSHEWVEGLLDLWHFTGDRRALDTAIGIGENVLRLLDTPMYQKAGEANARETGWALRSLTALYVETNDSKWIAKCEWIVEQFRIWKNKYGAWLAPYTDNTVIRIGFMISVAVGSLMRYQRVFPNEELRQMILEAVDDLIDNALNPYGLFYYKELPSLMRNGNNTLLLESMYIGYELTGDVKYLKAGLRTFKEQINAGASYDSGKRITEDAVLVGHASPKGFAQSFLPLTLFYNAVLEEGFLD